jgi:hypothetical protein
MSGGSCYSDCYADIHVQRIYAKINSNYNKVKSKEFTKYILRLAASNPDVVYIIRSEMDVIASFDDVELLRKFRKGLIKSNLETVIKKLDDDAREDLETMLYHLKNYIQDLDRMPQEISIHTSASFVAPEIKKKRQEANRMKRDYNERTSSLENYVITQFNGIVEEYKNHPDATDITTDKKIRETFNMMAKRQDGLDKQKKTKKR